MSEHAQNVSLQTAELSKIEYELAEVCVVHIQQLIPLHPDSEPAQHLCSVFELTCSTHHLTKSAGGLFLDLLCC